MKFKRKFLIIITSIILFPILSLIALFSIPWPKHIENIIEKYIGFDCTSVWNDSSVEGIEKINNVCIQKHLDINSITADNYDTVLYSLIPGIKRYKVNDIFIYAINDKLYKDFIPNENNEYDYILNINGEEKSYKTKEEAPTYVKINSITSHSEWFKNFSEMSKEDKKIFEKLEKQEDIKLP